MLLIRAKFNYVKTIFNLKAFMSYLHIAEKNSIAK